MARNEVTCQTLKILSEDTGRYPWELRIVRWNNGSPMLEKRSFFQNKEDQRRSGKNLGLRAEDMKVILDNLEEVQQLLWSD